MSISVQTLPTPTPTLKLLSGEFASSTLEADYQAKTRDRRSKELRIALVVAGLLMLMFGLSDRHMLGPGIALNALLADRLVVALTLFGFAALCALRPGLLDRVWPLNLVMAVLSTGILLIVPLRPETISTQHTAIIVATIFYYLYIPNRLAWQLAAAVYLGGGFLLMCHLFADASPGDLLIMGLLLVLVNVAGYLISLRLNRLQRQQLALLRAQHDTNESLQARMEETLSMAHQLRTMAEIDDLTGLYNRRRFLELAQVALNQAEASGQPLVLCMLDLDHFKAINDEHGHAIGDRVLKEVASVLQGNLREGEIIGRFGGEEFIVALPGAGEDRARNIAERLRRAVEQIDMPVIHPLSLSITIGIAAVAPGSESSSLENALIRADQALYRGKLAGRNRVDADN